MVGTLLGPKADPDIIVRARRRAPALDRSSA
jgi:hypothetical protein